MAKKKVATKLEDIIVEATERFKLAMDAETDNWRRAKEAIAFRDLEQWPVGIKRDRENDPDGARPCLVVDKINQYLNQVKNDQRQNRPGIKIRAVDDKADPKVAEVIQGWVRHIEECSRAGVAYDNAHDNALDGGFGYIRVLTDYIDDNSFDQEPRIVRVRNRFSVLLDPGRQEPDGSDARWALVYEKLNRDEFDAKYPKAKPVSFEEYGEIAGDWCGDDYVIICEYYRIVEESEEIAQLPSGEVVMLEDVPEGTKPLATRKRTKKTIEWRKLTAAEELDFREIPGDYIPIAEVVGNELDVEGERKLSGLVRGAMDGMRMYNYAASAFVERVALESKAPWIAADEQIEGYENEWRTSSKRNIAVLKYRPVLEGGVLIPAPQRQPMPGIPAGWQQVLNNFEHDIQASMGMYASNLGRETTASSGVQEKALQQRGDTATFHYADNLALAIQHVGRILIGMVPALLDTERAIRTLSEDGKEDYARIDPNQKVPMRMIQGKDGKQLKYYNPSIGKYDVIATVGPAYTTKRQEGAAILERILSASPDLMQIMGDLFFRSLDAPYMDKAADRLKMMLPPQLQDKSEETNLPIEAQQAIAQAQQMIEQQKQGIAMAAQELEKMQKQAQDETMQATHAKSAVALDLQKLKNEQDSLSAAEQVFQARIAEESAKREAALLKFEKQIQEAAQASESEQGEIASDASAQMTAAIMEGQQQVMQAVQALVETIMAPKTKTSKVVGPSGATYELTTTEQMVE